MQEEILECVRALPSEEREKVREFAARPRSQGGCHAPLKTLEGLWARYGLNLTDEDIAQGRREMWEGFPGSVNS